jgi:hypothetical protein
MRGYGVSSARRPRRGKKPAIILLIVALGLLVFFIFGKNKDETPPANSAPAKTSEDKPLAESVKGKYIFSGTIVLSRAVEAAARTATGYDNQQPFSKLDTLDFGQYDAGVIDLECPSTNTRVPYDASVRSLTFSCHPDWFPALKKYYQIVNIASNHTYDMGKEGFDQTVENIESAGMQSVGHYSPRIKEDICEVVVLPVRVQKTGGGQEDAKLPVALCAFHYQFHLEPLPGEIETIKEYSKTMPVIGLMHAGVEYTAEAIPLQQEIARKMIDYGAEFVVGNGAHWVQNTEVYKDKLIVYSTGNFIFDQLDYETRLGFSLSAEMTLPFEGDIEQWLELAADCKPREDNCLQIAQEKGLAKLEPKFKFDAISSYGGYQEVTQKASPAQTRDIERMSNWDEALKELGQQE